jgi:hypothetical protein
LRDVKGPEFFEALQAPHHVSLLGHTIAGATNVDFPERRQLSFGR